MRTRIPAAAIIAAIIISACASAQAQSPAEFYRNAGIRISVGFGSGGGYDIYARTLARHLGKHVAGNPSVVVQNMPGAGSLKAANFIAVQAPKDGSHIATFSRGIAFQPLIDNRGFQFDPLKLAWIGSPATEVSIVFARKDKNFGTIQEVMRRPFISPASGTGADSAIYPYIMNALIGTQFKVVTGYRGSGDFMLSIEKGESDGSAGSSISTVRSSRPHWETEKSIDIILQLALKKHPDFPDVPLILDLAKSAEDRQTMELIFARQSIAFPFAAPGETPPDRLQALRTGFYATVTDPAFIAEATKQGMEVDLVKAEEVEAILKRVFASPPAVISRAKEGIAAGISASSKK